MNIYKYLWFFGTKPKDSEVTIMPSGKTVEVSRDKTLLTAALDAGLDFPHNCKFGSCGACKCKLVKGKIKPRYHDTKPNMSCKGLSRGS